MESVEDWSFARNVVTVELQLLEPERSRTVWVLVHDRAAYIPCGVPNFRLWKQWPHEAVVQGAALVRLDDQIYPVELVKDQDPERFAALVEQLDDKYSPGSAGSMTPDRLWLFRLDPRRRG